MRSFLLIQKRRDILNFMNPICNLGISLLYIGLFFHVFIPENHWSIDTSLLAECLRWGGLFVLLLSGFFSNKLTNRKASLVFIILYSIIFLVSLLLAARMVDNYSLLSDLQYSEQSILVGFVLGSGFLSSCAIIAIYRHYKQLC